MADYARFFGWGELVPDRERYGWRRGMAQLLLRFKTVIALLKAGPWGHPIISHHRLHKG